MRVVALDVGEKRIGLAVSDPSGRLASPHGVLRRQSKQEDFARLDRILRELGAELVVVGLPYSLSGHELIGPQARRVLRYAEALAETIDVPITFFDESYSTVEAEERLRQAGRKHKAPIDAAAAAVILQNFLDSQ
ncbi:MAG: Holliday junction resolvase RuvX [Anaerolineae bacterium]